MSCPSPIIHAFNNKEYCDLVITCGRFRWDVHKLVVCTASRFFRNACSFAVGKEAEDKCIDLPEDEPGMVQRLITFFYKGDYEPTSIRGLESLKTFNDSAVSEDPALLYHNLFSVPFSFIGRETATNTSAQPVEDNSACACVAQTTLASVAQSSQPTVTAPSNLPFNTSVLARLESTYQIKDPLTTHASMYALAGKYFVEPLAVCAKRKFTNCIADHWDSEDFIAAVHIIYRSTPDEDRGLRDVVVEAFRNHFKVNVFEIPGAEAKLAYIDELSFLLMKSWPGKSF